MHHVTAVGLPRARFRRPGSHLKPTIEFKLDGIMASFALRGKTRPERDHDLCRSDLRDQAWP